MIKKPKHITYTQLIPLLRSIEFASSGYCSACGGWETIKGQGCNKKAHTKDCWIYKIIK